MPGSLAAIMKSSDTSLLRAWAGAASASAAPRPTTPASRRSPSSCPERMFPSPYHDVVNRHSRTSVAVFTPWRHRRATDRDIRRQGKDRARGVIVRVVSFQRGQRGQRGAPAMTVDGLTTIASANGPEDTVSRLETALRDKGMTLFARIDHAAGAVEAGLELRPTVL